ncbi:UvrD-helicase domain-containing protein [Streptomyces violens]|uniref:UvrD-helicase domain-containing protein n=1 Tax=Streptomyces violens TaxID=66377 RepID=UPI0004BF6DD5|nr:UvrD-helicase domain-containing protein [Streptomyces violens]
MTSRNGDGFSLTPAQSSVVTQPWDARTLVTAGAGAGKTTTLTYRLEHLTGTEELEAGEILVLSFSRAAVRELRERVDRLATTARRVRAQTFDGWALSLLLLEDPQRNDLAGTGFDRRIRMATQAIERGVLDECEQGVPAHVVIDEVQDLVGARRDMVEALLDRYADNCGFTVVGDAAQAVYGFQVTDPDERAAETNLFLRWVRCSFGDDLVEVTLADNFRARTPESRIALSFGAPLQNLSDDAPEAAEEGEALYAELRSELSLAPAFGSFDDPFTLDSLRHFDGTTAILCRDNGQVLHLAERLDELGVDHRIQRSPRSRPAPVWMADLLLATGAGRLTEDRFLELVALPQEAASKRTWHSLRRCAGGARGTLDLEALRRAIAEGRLPDELTAPPVHPLVVSTVHRAKGLEFDRVIVVEPQAPSDWRGKHRDAPAEARLLYVAMTRPRDDIYRLSRPNTWMIRKHQQIDRWYVGGRQSYVRAGVEAGDLDVCREAPAGATEPTSDPVLSQQYLREGVRCGDPVELYRLHDLPASAEETPPYGIFHEGRPIGAVSDRFRRDMWRLLKTNVGRKVERWPCRVTGLRVDTVETVAGFPALTERLGLGDRGVWIAPRLCGLGRFDWTHAETLPEGHCHP